MSKGVYGIYVEDELIYIGETTTSFEERFLKHLEAVEGKRHRQLVHWIIRDAKEKGKSARFVPLIDVDELRYKGKRIDNRDIQAMEYALIL